MKANVRKEKNKKSIYLDFASATPIDPRVLSAYVSVSKKEFGNPSALHHEGVSAKQALFTARSIIAKTLDVHAREIVFTSGGTEGDNLAIVGSVRSESVQKYVRGKKPHIIISSIEHAAIIETAKILSESGEASVSYLPVDNEGIVLVQELKKMLRPETVLVSVMYANNEIGTIQPIREIAKTLRHARKEKGMFPLLHTDATQAGNYLPLRIPPLGVDLMTLNSSKIYGPKGVGALFVRDGIILSPLMHGGIQEGGFRPGTENVAGCVAFSRALAITQSMMKKESERLSSLQNFFFNELSKAFPDSVINGSRALRLPNNVHVSFPEISSETLTLYLDARGIYVSEKSACKASMEEPSHVITALGKNTGMGSIRFSMGRSTTRNDIKRTIAALKDIRALIGKAPLAR